ncbi:MAG: hypothetical protein JSR71_09260 [Proteobacteria bacterium]|nr:hypothetical protein [Pseudomonadota bacterium]
MTFMVLALRNIKNAFASHKTLAARPIRARSDKSVAMPVNRLFHSYLLTCCRLDSYFLRPVAGFLDEIWTYEKKFEENG